MKNKTYLKLLHLCLFAILFYPCSVYASSLFNTGSIDEYYASRDGQPLWVKNARLTSDAKDVVDILRQSWTNGLNPEKYHINQIDDILSQSRRIDPENLTVIELLITDGYIEYSRDMSGMRLNPRDIGLNPKHWVQKLSAQDILTFIKNKDNDLVGFLKSLEPQTKTYQILKAELVNLVQNQEKKVHEPVRFPQTVRPGRGYDDIPKLRARLGLEAVEGVDTYKYDELLVNAVKDFQQKKGLNSDGLIGKQTLFALNQTNDHKINQLIINMERLRWLPAVKPNRFIVVNIPSYTLWAVENDQVVFEMPVVVGRKKRQTLSFVTEIHGVRFNPTWTVPKTIKKEDILPKLVEDPTYLSGKGMELYSGVGEEAITLDPTSIDWQTVTKEDLAGFRMVQGYGANNPLGRIRILMPNQHNIYLHDTNERNLFLRTNRARSSGCVRMKDPERVAGFILKTKAGWSGEKTQNMINRDKMTDIYTNEKMPVYLLYHTVWLGNENQVVYGNDIYGYDASTMEALEKVNAMPTIENYKASSYPPNL